jgi:hypothetical protein
MNNRGTLGGFFRNTGATDRPIYTESGALRYLQFDGTNDYLEWIGTAGDINFSSGLYMLIGILETTNVTNAAWVGGCGTAGESFDAQHGFELIAGDTGSQSVWSLFGRFNSNGSNMSDFGGSPLPLAMIELEFAPATGATNANLRVRRVADSDLVDKDSDAVASGQFPNNATALSKIILAAFYAAGVPSGFANYRMYCGIMVHRTVTTQERTDMREWVAGKVGW